MIISEHTDDKPTDIKLICALLLILITVIWMSAGIAGYIISIVCCRYSGTRKQKIIGLALALFTGPMYWIYFFLADKYCLQTS